MNKIKVTFRLEQDEDDYPPFAVEDLWALATDKPAEFVIDNIPFFVRAVALGDNRLDRPRPNEATRRRWSETPPLFPLKQRSARARLRFVHVHEDAHGGPLSIGQRAFAPDHDNRAMGEAEKVEWRKADAAKIQAAADRHGVTVTVVGSRAKGTATAESELEYVLEGGNSRKRHNIKHSLPRGGGGGEIRSTGTPSGKDFFSPPVGKSQPHQTFTPKVKERQ